MSTYLLVLVFLLTAPAQQTTTPNPADLCTIRGLVVKAGTGEPLSKATVEAAPAHNPPELTGAVAETETDAMGRFELKGLAPGRYRLMASHDGFVREQQYGQRNPDEPGVMLMLSAGQKITHITFRLIPAAIITGHVFDEDGEPVVSARVQAMHYRYFRGQRRLVASGLDETNDLGEFRIFGLSPGQYVVQATTQDNGSARAKTKKAYLPAYYPGVPDAGRATPITLQGGEEFAGVDINLQSVQTVAVRGNILSAGCGTTPHGAMVFLQKLSAENLSLWASFQNMANAQGAFEFFNVLPGSYYLYSELFDERKQCFGRLTLEVADADIDGVTLIVNPRIEIRGHVRFEGQANSDLGSTEVTLAPKIISIPFGVGISGPGSGNGSFTLKSVFDGDYQVYVENLPEIYFVKSARLDGVDVLTTGVTVDARHDPGSLEILVSPNGASIEGVISKDQQPFQGATVAIVPDPPHRAEERLFKSTTTDQLGHFVLQGLSPGEFKVFAWERIEPGAYTNTEFLQPYENLGESVHITEGSHNSVQVDLIPAKDSGQ